MYKNKNKDGSLNLSGGKIAQLRIAQTPKLSQQGLASQLQLLGLDIDKNAIQKMEAGKRFITDIELMVTCSFFQVTAEELWAVEV